jgi:hypothetical protein
VRSELRVIPLDWAIVAAGAAAFGFSFASYYRFSLKGLPRGVDVSGYEGAFHGFFGWFATVLALIGSLAIALEIFWPILKPHAANKVVALGSYALATLSVIMAWVVVPNAGNGPLYNEYIDEGHGAGYWVNLTAIIAGLVLTVLRVSRSREGLAFGSKRAEREVLQR